MSTSGSRHPGCHETVRGCLPICNGFGFCPSAWRLKIRFGASPGDTFGSKTGRAGRRAVLTSGFFGRGAADSRSERRSPSDRPISGSAAGKVGMFRTKPGVLDKFALQASDGITEARPLGVIAAGTAVAVSLTSRTKAPPWRGNGRRQGVLGPSMLGRANAGKASSPRQRPLGERPSCTGSWIRRPKQPGEGRP